MHIYAHTSDSAWLGCGQAQIEQWIDFSTLELDAPLLSWFLPIAGFWDYDKKASRCLDILVVTSRACVYRDGWKIAKYIATGS